MNFLSSASDSSGVVLSPPGAAIVLVVSETAGCEGVLGESFGIRIKKTKPLAERMAAVGMSKQAIDRISSLFDAFDKVRLGRMDEVPEDIRLKLADSADAKISALDQLQDVLDARRSK